MSTFKSETMALRRQRVDCPLQVTGESLPQVEMFKYLRLLFTIKGEMQQEIDRWIGGSVGSDSHAKAISCGEERAEPEGKAFDLPVNQGPNFYPWP